MQFRSYVLILFFLIGLTHAFTAHHVISPRSGFATVIYQPRDLPVHTTTTTLIHVVPTTTTETRVITTTATSVSTRFHTVTSTSTTTRYQTITTYVTTTHTVTSYAYPTHTPTTSTWEEDRSGRRVHLHNGALIIEDSRGRSPTHPWSWFTSYAHPRTTITFRRMTTTY